MNTKAPNCWQCRFFAVSWDPSKPYACQLMGFKTKVLPSIEVLRADGERCRGFIQKEAMPQRAPTPNVKEPSPMRGWQV